MEGDDVELAAIEQTSQQGPSQKASLLLRCRLKAVAERGRRRNAHRKATRQVGCRLIRGGHQSLKQFQQMRARLMVVVEKV